MKKITKKKRDNLYVERFKVRVDSENIKVTVRVIDVVGYLYHVGTFLNHRYIEA